MKSIPCAKCGQKLDASGPQYSGLPHAEAIKKFASDHASKSGCDWAAANLAKVTAAMK